MQSKCVNRYQHQHHHQTQQGKHRGGVTKSCASKQPLTSSSSTSSLSTIYPYQRQSQTHYHGRATQDVWKTTSASSLPSCSSSSMRSTSRSVSLSGSENDEFSVRTTRPAATGPQLPPHQPNRRSSSRCLSPPYLEKPRPGKECVQSAGTSSSDEFDLFAPKLTKKTSTPVANRKKSARCNILPMSAAELSYIEMAHKESRLLELYKDVNWRFYAHPPMSFALFQLKHIPPSIIDYSKHLATKFLTCNALLPPDLEAMSNFAKVMSEDQQSQTTTRPPPPPSPLFSESGKFEVSKMDVLSETIWHYHTRVEQTEATLAKKLSLRDMLYSAIAPLFPMCGLYVVGSSLNGFGNNSSDMDLCLMITNKELDQRSDAVVVLNMILYQLQTEKFVAQQQLILAKVPILRITFQEPYEDITVDLNANNSVAIKNTHLLCYYSSFDWRVRPIVSVVKEWAKRKGINDANHSTFTSYSLVLMVIHYLQCGAQTPVLPSLQKLYHDRFRKNVDVRSLNVTQPLPALPDDGWKFNETSTLGELLIGFLDYYANHFNYEQDAISIREGCRIDKMQLARQKHGGTTPSTSTSSVSLNATVDAADKTTKTSSAVPSTTAVSSAPTATSVATPAPSTATGVAQTSTSPPAPSTSMFQAHPMAWQTQWRCICIEEPFTHTNTAHSVYDENVFAAIKEAFREAHAELEVHRDLGQLMTCKPINIKGPSAGAVVYYAQYNENKAQSTPTATVASTVPTPPAIPPMIPPAAISSAVHASISSIVPSSSSNVKSSADGSQMSTSGGANPTTTITPNGVVVQHTSTRNNNRNNNRYNSTSNSRSNSGTSQQKTPLVAKVTLPVRANDEEKENVSDVSADATSSTAASTTATTTMAPVPSLIKVVLPAADSSAPMAVPSVVSTAPSVAV